LRTPAQITREVSEIASKNHDISFRLSSLKPVNPTNKADAWEEKILKELKETGKYATNISKEENRTFYRLLKPLLVEQSCLACHAQHGYKVGDVRGALSVSVSFDSELVEIRKNLLQMAILTIALILIFIITIYWFIWRLFKRLSTQNTELQILNENQNKFLGFAAHDLRNPLTVIMGNAEFLLDEPSSEDIKEISRSIVEASQKMLSLINTFLDVSKIKAGKLKLDLKPVKVISFLHECAKSIQFIAVGKNIRLEIVEPEIDPGMIRVDEQYMGQVFNNLISNAVKYSYQGSLIQLGAVGDDNEVKLYVKDNGQGIRPEEITRLFEAFEKVGSVTSSEERSHGLGLAIVKKVVEYHGGRIEVESEPGKGSVFSVFLKQEPSAK
jgi:signal transduction histidine kinase